jgi:methylglutaconyl-CoA hydratase
VARTSGVTAPEETSLQFETISLDISPRGIATILLNRPDRGNAFNQAMLVELAHVFTRLAADDATRLAVLRGSGKHFCAGADLAERAHRTDGAGTGAPAGPTLLDVLEAIDRLPKPTVAGIHGGAIGGGAAIAACCDIVVATDGAFFSIPEVRVGMAPVRLAPVFIRAMGYRSFRRYGISGERIDATEALRIGMVHRLCAPHELEGAIAATADALLHGAPGAIRELKSACAKLAMPPWPAETGAEPATHELARTLEAAEGIASFREKRKPSWYPA